MGKIELDDRGRFTIPALIREKLNLKPVDRLSIEIEGDNLLKLQKTPTKDEIFKHLVGCIKFPQKKSLSIKEIKGIWKVNP